MPYLAGTPVREPQGGRKVTTVHIDSNNYQELMHLLKSNRYNFSHFMDNLISVILRMPEIIDLILEEE